MTTDEEYVKKWLKSHVGVELRTENQRLYGAIKDQLADGCLLSCDPMEAKAKCCSVVQQIRFYVIEASQVMSICVVCGAWTLQPATCIRK